MNCERGDNAVVVMEIASRNRLTGERLVLAKPGTIVHCAVLDPVAAYWYIEQPIPFDVTFSDGFRYQGRIKAIADHALRPLRDPGDDAVDQTLVPGYVRDEVTA